VFLGVLQIAAHVYQNTYKNGVVKGDDSLDYSGNFSRMLGTIRGETMGAVR
jgi:citrate synthase